MTETGKIELVVRPLVPDDRAWVREKMVEEWGSELAIVHGTVFRPVELPGFVAEAENKIAGLVTYNVEGTDCEIVTLNSWLENAGVGSKLIAQTIEVAIQQGCKRLFLVTTNDNLHALGFYQKRGFTICAVRLDAVAQSRLIKPEIPLLGNENIPIRDEIELEIKL